MSIWCCARNWQYTLSAVSTLVVTSPILEKHVQFPLLWGFFNPITCDLHSQHFWGTHHTNSLKWVSHYPKICTAFIIIGLNKEGLMYLVRDQFWCLRQFLVSILDIHQHAGISIPKIHLSGVIWIVRISKPQMPIPTLFEVESSTSFTDANDEVCSRCQ